jgi:hypothetical protein
MIATKEPQIIDAINRREGIVYLKAMNRSEDDIEKTVKFDVEMYTLEPIFYEKNMRFDKINEFDEVYTEYRTVNVVQNQFRFIGKKQAIYKMNTFYSVIGNVTPEQYDDVLIQQIDYVNKRVLTGNEIQKDIYFWNLTELDLEKVTEQEINILTSPQIQE